MHTQTICDNLCHGTLERCVFDQKKKKRKIQKGGGTPPANHQLAMDQSDHNHDDFLKRSCHTTTVLALPRPEKTSPVVSSRLCINQKPLN